MILTCPKATGLDIASEISLATSCCSAMSSIMSWTWMSMSLDQIPSFILYCYLVNVKICICFLQGLGCIIHCLEHGCVRVSTLQRLSLHLDGGQCSIDLLQLFVVPEDENILEITFYPKNVRSHLFFLFRACKADLLFVLAFFLAVATSWSIFFSRNS